MKKKLITVGVVTALIITNGTISYQYAHDVKAKDQEISQLVKKNKYLSNQNKQLEESISTYENENKRLNNLMVEQENEINSLNGQLEEVKNRKEYPLSELTMELSFYTDSPDETGNYHGITKSGVDIAGKTTYQGMFVVAADTNVLPLHSIIEIEGLGKAVVLDTGSYIKGHKLDILVATKKEAFQRGRYDQTVFVLRYGKG